MSEQVEPRLSDVFRSRSGKKALVLRLRDKEELEEAIKRLTEMGWIIPVGQINLDEDAVGKFIRLKYSPNKEGAAKPKSLQEVNEEKKKSGFHEKGMSFEHSSGAEIFHSMNLKNMPAGLKADFEERMKQQGETADKQETEKRASSLKRPEPKSKKVSSDDEDEDDDEDDMEEIDSEVSELVKQTEKENQRGSDRDRPRNRYSNDRRFQKPRFRRDDRRPSDRRDYRTRERDY